MDVAADPKAGFQRPQYQAAKRDFATLVWPIVREWCGGGELLDVEAGAWGSQGSRLARILDGYCGIDWLQVFSERRVARGLASRIRYGPRVYRTFTLKSTTGDERLSELDRRRPLIEEPESGWTGSTFTVQAHLEKDGGAVLYVCMARTRHVLVAALRGLGSEPPANRYDGSRFLAIEVDDLRNVGFPVREWPE